MLTKSIRQQFDDENKCYQVTKNPHIADGQYCSLDDFLLDLRREEKISRETEAAIAEAGNLYSIIVPHNGGEFYAFAPTIDEAIQCLLEEMSNA